MITLIYKKRNFQKPILRFLPFTRDNTNLNVFFRYYLESDPKKICTYSYHWGGQYLLFCVSIILQDLFDFSTFGAIGPLFVCTRKNLVIQYVGLRPVR